MGTRPRAPAQYPSSATNAIGAELDAAARREVLAFPAEYLCDLPVAIRVELHGTGLGTAAVVLICRRLSEAEPCLLHTDAAELVFAAEEIRALAVGAQSERLRPADFRAFCLRKRIDPDFRVSEEVALDGARAERSRPGTPPWSLDRVLRSLELDITSLKYSGAEPVVQQAARAA